MWIQQIIQLQKRSFFFCSNCSVSRCSAHKITQPVLLIFVSFGGLGRGGCLGSFFFKFHLSVASQVKANSGMTGVFYHFYTIVESINTNRDSVCSINTARHSDLCLQLRKCDRICI